MSDDAAAPDSPPRRPIDLISDTGPSPDDQLRPVLQSRLRLVSGVFVLVCIARGVVYAPTESPEYLHVPNILCFIAMAGVAVWLRFAESSVRRLRGIEALILVIWCVRNAALHYYQAEASRGQLAPSDFHASLPWYTLIVSYGILIPTSWPRAALVSLVVGAMPMILTVMLEPEKGTRELLTLASQLGVAGAVSVFAAWHIDALTAEAFQARQLGQYRLKQKLGEGGMGEVYLAEHQLLHRPCAIKVIRSDRLATRPRSSASSARCGPRPS